MFTWGAVAAAVAAGVFIGLAVANLFVEKAAQGALGLVIRAAKRQREAVESQRVDSRYLSEKVVKRFEESDLACQLYTAETLSRPVRLPLIAPVERRQPLEQINFAADEYLTLANASRVNFPVDERLVKRILASGRRLTDDSVLYAAGATDRGLYIGVAGYRSTVTLAKRVRAGLENRWVSLEALEVATFDQAIASLNLRPLILGSDVACIFPYGSRLMIPLHRRSAKTVNAPGAWTLSPAYTYEPTAAVDVPSRFGILSYNFLRECLEEIWGEESLIETSGEPRADPDWIFDSVSGSALLAEVDSRRVQLYVTGVAIDLTHLCLTVSLAAVFNSPDFLRRAMKAPGSISEAEIFRGHPRLKFVDLLGPELDEMVMEHMKPTSAFTVDRARKFAQAWLVAE